MPRKGWFLSRSQYKLNLPEDVEEAMKYHGFPQVPKTAENVRRLYQDVLKQYLT